MNSLYLVTHTVQKLYRDSYKTFYFSLLNNQLEGVQKETLQTGKRHWLTLKHSLLVLLTTVKKFKL